MVATQEQGPDTMKTTVPYAEWLRVGRDKVIAFSESQDDAIAKRRLTVSSPVYDMAYRLVTL